MAGLLAVIIALIIRSKGQILNPFSIHPLSEYRGGLLDMVSIIVIPIVVCAAIGGGIRQLINKRRFLM